MGLFNKDNKQKESNINEANTPENVSKVKKRR